MPEGLNSFSLRDLKSLTNGEFLDDNFSLGRYSTDASIYQIKPQGVLIPKNKKDIFNTIDFCIHNKISILPRGGGTSQCGQTVNHSLVIDNSKYFNKVLHFDKNKQICIVEPGIVLDQLNNFLKPYGLWFPIDVSTSSRATIGGMAGNNSCGGRSIKYGMMRDNVLSIDAILNDGNEYSFGKLENINFFNKNNLNIFEKTVSELLVLAQENQDEILKKFPNVLRRVGGYNIDALLPDAMSLRPNGEKGDGINLSHLLVGSEGTLNYFTAITLKLSPLPSEKVMGVCHFPTFYEAMNAAQHLVTLNPVAVELIDETMIKLARNISIFKKTVEEVVKGNPEALLIVEFAESSNEKNLKKLSRLDDMMRDLGFSWENKKGGLIKISNKTLQGKVTEMRKSGLNIMMSMKTEQKPVSFVEDCAVKLENLADYTNDLKKIFKKYAVEGTWYAHASVGCLHVRPVLNMKLKQDVSKMRKIAEEASQLIKKYHGSFSGEHGDGIVRSEFIEVMFGEKMNEIFKQIKKSFDPNNIFNPGKIIDAPKMDDRNYFRFSPGYEAKDINTILDWSAWKGKSSGLQGAVEMCNNNGACRKLDNGVMCPSYRATLDEKDSTRGRANTLRLALTGQLGKDALTSKKMTETMELCVSCKACKRECPTGVDMAKMKVEISHLKNKKYGLSLNERMIAFLPYYAANLSYFFPILNFLKKIKVLPFLNDLFFKISTKRDVPLTKPNYFKSFELPNEIQKTSREPVIFFVDTFNKYYEPENIRSAIKVLKNFGYEPFLPISKNDNLCCGRTFLSCGVLDKAKYEAKKIVNTFYPFLKKGISVVGIEPSCILTFRDEIPSIIRDKKSDLLRKNSFTFEELLEKKLSKVKFMPSQKKVLLHGHCHQKAFDAMKPILKILKAIPKINFEVIDTSCCGMAGAFGYNKSTYDISIKMANDKLIPFIKNQKEDVIIIADGTSCRTQIKDGSNRRAMHFSRFLENLIIKE